MTTPENKNNLENNEIPKVTPENLEPKEISLEELLEYSNNEGVVFKNETAEEMEKSNSVNLDKETFEKIKNETGVENELAEIDKESEKIIAESQQEINSDTKNQDKPKKTTLEGIEWKQDEKSESTLENHTEELKNTVKKVQDLYIGLAEKYLDQKSTLKERIINYYSDSERLERELSVVFKGLNEQEINSEIERVSKLFENRTFFIEHNQKIHERTETFRRERERGIENPNATDEEYELGVYKEGLEMQVKDAVFALAKKGYKTFQSGFREKKDRDQYVDMYNKNINLPDSLIQHFREKGFEISTLHQNDRTSIDIHPIYDQAVTFGRMENSMG